MRIEREEKEREREREEAEDHRWRGDGWLESKQAGARATGVAVQLQLPPLTTALEGR